MLTKIHVVKLNNIWTQRSFFTPYLEYLKNTRFSPVKKKKNMVKSRKVIFRKSQKLLTEAAYSEHSRAIHSISIAGYVHAVPAFVCFELPALEASSFCDF